MESWNPFDLIVLVVLVLSTFWGGMRGVVSQIAAIASWIISWQLASRYYGLVDQLVTIAEPWRRPVASLIVFLVSAVAINFAARFLKRAISLSGLKEFDRQMGALFGLLKGLLICVVLAFFATIISQKTLETIRAAKSGRFFASVAAVVVSKTCADSDVGRKFLSTAEANFGSLSVGNASASGSEASGSIRTIDSEIAQLKAYLKRNVFSSTAAEIVEEADAAEENGGASVKKQSSVWNWFRADVQETKKDEAATDESRKNANAVVDASSNGRSGGDGWSDFGSGGANLRPDEAETYGESTTNNVETKPATSNATTENSKNSDALDGFASFFQSTFGGAPKTSAPNGGASDVAPAPDLVADGDGFLDEFIGVSSTTAKYGEENAAIRANEVGVDPETGIVAPSLRDGFAAEPDVWAPVEIGASDGSILSREASGANRLRIVPPMPY